MGWLCFDYFLGVGFCGWDGWCGLLIPWLDVWMIDDVMAFLPRFLASLRFFIFARVCHRRFFWAGIWDRWSITYVV